MVKEITTGALVMELCGNFDAMTRNTSALHELRSSRSGYELTIAVKQAVATGVCLRWVAVTEQPADALTKGKAKKVLREFVGERRHWRFVYDPQLTARKAGMSAESRKWKQAGSNRWTRWLFSLSGFWSPFASWFPSCATYGILRHSGN